MRISSLVRLCVAYVAAPTVEGRARLGGTGFFIWRVPREAPRTEIDNAARKQFSGATAYFVTARHVVEEVRKLGVEHLAVRVNTKDGNCEEFKVPVSAFHFHERPEVDLAAVPADIDQERFEVTPWILDETPEEEVFQKHNIGVGTGVSIIGLFKHHTGTQRNLPIVRTGNIAAMAEEKVSTAMGQMDAALIEARSIGGLSGSPVFANLGTSQIRINPDLAHYDFISGIHLFGVMHGHYDENADGERVNVGIGIVTPVSKIVELIRDPALSMEGTQLRVGEPSY
ncbi:trypsin-like serine protease [Variovorax sp. Sphag1AA]|uniref:trypsin-like serine protease n=1 Tax=Variovorax sp. Sphag1AA TaxID=2587027 RepID=UPI001616692A|nr:trypsin-like serine protease [Variovorax sp. Sphag1AA]MBB3181975.1 hypothetical protein [Variovorax sp. Sphag1AA]